MCIPRLFSYDTKSIGYDVTPKIVTWVQPIRIVIREERSYCTHIGACDLSKQSVCQQMREQNVTAIITLVGESDAMSDV